MGLTNVLNNITKPVSFGRNFLLGRPLNVSFNVTNNCNLMCEGCDFPLRSEQQKLERDPLL